MVCTPDMFYLSESVENSEELSQTCAPSTEEHTNMYHICLEELCKRESGGGDGGHHLVDSRIKAIDCTYYETCLDFLESLRVLTFS